MSISRLSNSFLLGVLFLFLMACQSEKTFSEKNPSKCKYGNPTAIFAKDTPTLVTSSFELKDNQGYEKVTFESGTEVEIHQSGCNEIQQELLFRLKNRKITNDIELFVTGIQQLDDIGSLSDALKPFSFWAQAIFNQKEALKKGKSIELAPNTFASIDLIEQAEDAIIRIILEQRG